LPGPAASPRHPAESGDIVCTGALTGMHPLAAGQRARADFGPVHYQDTDSR
jgi:2-keto-4-pentenoate hydratase